MLALATAGTPLAPAPVAWADGREPAEATTGASAIGLEADRMLRAMGARLDQALPVGISTRNVLMMSQA